MRKTNSSFIFAVLVCLLIGGVAIAKNTDNDSKETNTDNLSVVYPDYYYAKDSDTVTTEDKSTDSKNESDTDNSDTNDNIEAVETLIVTIPETAPASTDVIPKTSAPTKNISTYSASVKKTDSKNRLLSNMADNSVLSNALQNTANTIITAKAVKYQAAANGIALGASAIHNQNHQALVDIITAKTTAKADNQAHLLNHVSNTAKDIINTADTIQSHHKENTEQIHNNIHETLTDIKDLIDALPFR